MVTDEQVRLLRQKMSEGKKQETAAAAAAMSVRSARTWQRGPLPSETKQPRTWRTRTDPFAAIWEKEITPLLVEDKKSVLQAVTVLAWVQEKHPGEYGNELLRTLQRRIRDWRALYGPPKEVFFEQEHVPGREGAFDFTPATELGVTIAGVPLEHLLFEFVLTYSSWTWADVVLGGETYEAMSAGIQGALWDLGASPSVWRSDNLSAATHELKQTAGRTLTQRYKALLDHYGATSTRIQPGESHENGAVEQRHYRTKRAIAEALVIRGSSDFTDLDAYRAFVRETIARHNRQIEARLVEERPHLKPLPSSAVPSYTVFQVRVRKWSTIRVGHQTYSVPSRLRDHWVEVRRHPDTIEVRYHDKHVETMPRLRGEGAARIDYRHVIWSLVTKPGAFARYRYREELFPTLAFRRAYDALKARTERADVEYLRILHLAASTMEKPVEDALVAMLDAGEPVSFDAVRERVSPTKPSVPAIAIPGPDLTTYDRLLTSGGAA
jgi:hypothetical protein